MHSVRSAFSSDSARGTSRRLARSLPPKSVPSSQGSWLTFVAFVLTRGSRRAYGLICREIENEAKVASDFSSQYAVARTELRFKKGTKFVQIADLRFGIEFDQSVDVFAWQITLVPAARYSRVDDVVWHQWRVQPSNLAGARHQDKANTVRFVSRQLGSEVTAETAFNDVKAVWEFLLTVESALAEAVGLDAGPGEE